MSADNPLHGLFTDDESGLFELLLEQAGTIGELSRESDEHAMRALRFDEGIACLEWAVSRAIGSEAGGKSVELEELLRLLGELTAYGSVGLRPEWLDRARADMERDR